MSMETWFRNPHQYIRELVECSYGKIAWDQGSLVKRRVDPYAFSNLYFAKAIPWESLVIDEEWTTHIDADHPMNNPLGVYPNWSSMEEWDTLLEMVENPVGEDARACFDTSISVNERPVYNQQHRVMIINIPPLMTGLGKALMRKLKELQEEHPECIIHPHALYSYRMTYGFGFRSTDTECRSRAAKGQLMLPNGKAVAFEETAEKWASWRRVMGFSTKALESSSNRILFNIKSALWAGEHYPELYNFRSIALPNDAPVDHETPQALLPKNTTKSFMLVPVPPKAGDKQLCDTCSLSQGCKYYREGAVCSLPGADPTSLAKMFGTRDASTIMDGIGIILSAQAERYERGVMWEQVDGELDPELTRIAKQLIDGGSKLAKLLDPSLQNPGVQVNVSPGGAAAVMTASPKQVVAGIMHEIESSGVPRDRITQEMVKDILNQMQSGTDKQKAIEGHVVAYRDERS